MTNKRTIIAELARIRENGEKIQAKNQLVKTIVDKLDGCDFADREKLQVVKVGETLYFTSVLTNDYFVQSQVSLKNLETIEDFSKVNDVANTLLLFIVKNRMKDEETDNNSCFAKKLREICENIAKAVVSDIQVFYKENYKKVSE